MQQNGLATTIVTGSLQDAAKKQNKSLAELYALTRLVILSDNSSSMDDYDARNSHGQTDRRFKVRDEFLKKFEAQYPGQIAVLSFASDAKPIPGGLQDDPHGGTHYKAAFDLLDQLYIPGQKVLFVSDGEPFETLQEITPRLAKYDHQIDFAFAGGMNDQEGKAFLKAMAKCAHGQYFENVLQVASAFLALESHVTRLMLEAHA